jgi:tetratricopeptide (TPR) repeat protein
LFAAVSAPSVARDARDAIDALERAHSCVEEVREADTPGPEDHKVRRYHLDLLARASRELEVAQKLDPDAVLEGQHEEGIARRYSINELKAEALLLEGITLHAYDIKRAIAPLRESTALNANRPYGFYVLGLTYVANMNRARAVAALQRAVALDPENLLYRSGLDRARSLSTREVAAHKAASFGKEIVASGNTALSTFVAVWKIVRSPRRIFFAVHRGAFRYLRLPRFH